MPSQAKEKNQHICVAVRCRPLNPNEKGRGSCSVAEAQTSNNTVSVRSSMSNINSYQKVFTYDHVFGPTTQQIEIYKNVVAPAVEEVMMGYNCTIFAYGQTGTGKTFTMEGEKSPQESGYSWEEDPLAGIIPRALHHLFESLQGQGCEFSVRVSFLEIYNEELIDLLGAESVDNPRLKIYEDTLKKGSCVIHGLEEVVVHNKDEVYHILEKGTSRRQTAATLMNAHSSRSHSVFMVTVHIKENTLEGEELLKTGKLNLVDLAGSECVGRSGAVEKRAREAGQINQSLLTLGRVITALVEHAPHVPYRESKLTRLLQDSLGGRTKTSIIATISPASCCLEETLSTLEYAHRAKNITNKPEINQKLTKKMLLKEYTEEIERLRRDLQAARDKTGVFIATENFEAMEIARTQQEQAIMELENEMKFTKEQMEKDKMLFDELQQELQATSEELQQTSKRLEHTKGHLKQSRRDAAEKKHLLEHHVGTEKQLFNQAQQLLEVSEESTQNVAGLFDKIERKRAVEQQNSELQEKFYETYSSTLTGMVEDLQTFQRGQDQLFKSYQDTFEKMMSKRMQEIIEGLQMVNRLQTTLMQDQHETAVREKTFLKNSAQLVKKTMEDMETNETNLVQDHRSFHENVVLHTISIAADQLNKAKELIMRHQDSLSRVLKENRTYADDFTNLMHQRIGELTHIMAATQEDRQKLLDQVQELTKKLNSKQAETRMNFQQEAMKALESCFAKYQEECAQAEKQTEAKVEEVVREFQTTVEEKDDKQHRVRVALIEETDEHAEKFMGRVALAHQMTEQTILQIKGYVDKINTDVCEDLQSSHVNMQIQLEKQAANNVEAVSANITRHQIEMTNHLNDFTTQMKTTRSDVDSQFDTINKHMDDDEAALQASLDDLTKQLASGLGTIDSWTLSHEEQLLSCKKELQNYVDQLAKDMPTGNTPQRKEFLFPNNLVQSRRHSMLLREFNQKIDEMPEEDLNNSFLDKVVSSSEGEKLADDLVDDLTSEQRTSETSDSSKDVLNTSGDSAISAVSTYSGKSCNKENQMKPPSSKRAPRSVQQLTQKGPANGKRATRNTSPAIKKSSSKERLAEGSRLPLKTSQQ